MLRVVCLQPSFWQIWSWSPIQRRSASTSLTGKTSITSSRWAESGHHQMRCGLLSTGVTWKRLLRFRLGVKEIWRSPPMIDWSMVIFLRKVVWDFKRRSWRCRIGFRVVLPASPRVTTLALSLQLMPTETFWKPMDFFVMTRSLDQTGCFVERRLPQVWWLMTSTLFLCRTWKTAMCPLPPMRSSSRLLRPMLITRYWALKRRTSLVLTRQRSQEPS